MSGRPPILVERWLAATPARVFAAFADPASIAVWMCPGEEVRGASAELDFREGGRFRIAMHGAERDFVQHGRYLRIEPDARIEMTWISEWVPPEDAETLVTISLTPEGEGTRIRIVQDRLPATGDAYADHPAGWQRILRCLGAHLAR